MAHFIWGYHHSLLFMEIYFLGTNLKIHLDSMNLFVNYQFLKLTNCSHFFNLQEKMMMMKKVTLIAKVEKLLLFFLPFRLVSITEINENWELLRQAHQPENFYCKDFKYLRFPLSSSKKLCAERFLSRNRGEEKKNLILNFFLIFDCFHFVYSPPAFIFEISFDWIQNCSCIHFYCYSS